MKTFETSFRCTSWKLYLLTFFRLLWIRSLNTFTVLRNQMALYLSISTHIPVRCNTVPQSLLGQEVIVIMNICWNNGSKEERKSNGRLLSIKFYFLPHTCSRSLFFYAGFSWDLCVYHQASVWRKEIYIKKRLDCKHNNRPLNIGRSQILSRVWRKNGCVWVHKLKKIILIYPSPPSDARSQE